MGSTVDKYCMIIGENSYLKMQNRKEINYVDYLDSAKFYPDCNSRHAFGR